MQNLRRWSGHSITYATLRPVGPIGSARVVHDKGRFLEKHAPARRCCGIRHAHTTVQCIGRDPGRPVVVKDLQALLPLHRGVPQLHFLERGSLCGTYTVACRRLRLHEFGHVLERCHEELFASELKGWSGIEESITVCAQISFKSSDGSPLEVLYTHGGNDDAIAMPWKGVDEWVK